MSRLYLTRLHGLLLSSLLLLAGCAHSPLLWAGLPGREDPDPTGPRYLQEYKEAHYTDLGADFVRYLSSREFLTQLTKARVLYLGDHHDDQRLHARFRHVLTAVHKAGLRPVVGLEAIGEQDATELRAFLDNDIELGELRRRMSSRWAGSWLDSNELDSAFYRDVLRAARARKQAVFALEPTPRIQLSDRDEIIASNIRGIHLIYPERLIIVMVGHAHLLGEGQLIERVGLPAVALGARMSVSLRRSYGELRPPRGTEFVQSSSGVLFLYPDPATDS